jgi:lipopolysaccharide transport system ATP-binding protein
MSDAVVVVDGLSKRYRVYATPWDRLLEALTRRPRHRDFHALDGVGFTLERGEGLAVIGENGAGKSTLLKILAGITAPTSGRLEVKGKIASILELGSGFHPEFTGRQNVVLNAAMLGLSEAEVKQRMPDILGFSELGEFIDQPVKCYSTGMAMRLGFSIATQVDPDVLIIDEALSVGDGYFQKKCMDRLQRYVESGGTLLFCSHAMYYVSAFCRRAMWLKQGRVEALGAVEPVVRAYENYLVAKGDRAAAEEPAPGAPRAVPAAAGRRARITALRVTGGALPSEPLRCGDPLSVTLEWETTDPALAFHAGISITRRDGLEVATFATHLDRLPPLSGRGRHRVELELPRLPLIKGEFEIHAYVLDEKGLYVFDRHLESPAFSVAAAEYRFGLIDTEHRWRREPDAEPVPEAIASGARLASAVEA